MKLHEDRLQNHYGRWALFVEHPSLLKRMCARNSRIKTQFSGVQLEQTIKSHLFGFRMINMSTSLVFPPFSIVKMLLEICSLQIHFLQDIPISHLLLQILNNCLSGSLDVNESRSASTTYLTHFHLLASNSKWTKLGMGQNPVPLMFTSKQPVSGCF